MTLQVIQAKGLDGEQKFYVYDIVNGQRRGGAKSVNSTREQAEAHIAQIKAHRKSRFI